MVAAFGGFAAGGWHQPSKASSRPAWRCIVPGGLRSLAGLPGRSMISQKRAARRRSSRSLARSEPSVSNRLRKASASRLASDHAEMCSTRMASSKTRSLGQRPQSQRCGQPCRPTRSWPGCSPPGPVPVRHQDWPGYQAWLCLAIWPLPARHGPQPCPGPGRDRRPASHGPGWSARRSSEPSPCVPSHGRAAPTARAGPAPGPARRSARPTAGGRYRAACRAPTTSRWLADRPPGRHEPEQGPARGRTRLAR
jgi:hypothetical protein